MHQHLGHSGGNIAHVQHGKDTKEEIHWCVEARVQLDQGDNEPIAHECGKVEKEEDVEEDYISLGIPGESQKDKLRHRAVVHPGEVLHYFSAAVEEMDLVVQLIMHIQMLWLLYYWKGPWLLDSIWNEYHFKDCILPGVRLILGR